MSIVTVTNAHGTFTADTAVVDRLWFEHQTLAMEDFRKAVAAVSGEEPSSYDDVTSRVEILVMVNDSLRNRKIPPEEKRLTAIKAIVDKCFDGTVVPYRFVLTEDGAHDLATEIRNLQSLGRTKRWRETVVGWADLVEEEAKTTQGLRWAVLQGSIQAGHAAD